MSKKKNISESFALLIKAERLSRGLTLEYLSEKAGLHRTTVGLIEAGKRTPSLEVASSLAAALEIKIGDMLNKIEHIHGKIMQQQDSRKALSSNIRNENILFQETALTKDMLIAAINHCYKTFDSIDNQLYTEGGSRLTGMLELANVSAMIGNILAIGLASNSNGLYTKNKPHTFPDLLPVREPAVDLEIKVALESNRPKGHLPKPGMHITFRYVLCENSGEYNIGKDCRGDVIFIWEVKIGYLTESDFRISNTEGDSGKTAVIDAEAFNKMTLIYFDSERCPYRSGDRYRGFN